jgi:hypothetical protein
LVPHSAISSRCDLSCDSSQEFLPSKAEEDIACPISIRRSEVSLQVNFPRQAEWTHINPIPSLGVLAQIGLRATMTVSGGNVVTKLPWRFSTENTTSISW